MIGAPDNAGAPILRAAKASEAEAVQAVWEESSKEDDPGGWPRGGWSVAAWATDSCVLVVGSAIVGVVAVRAERAPDGAMLARAALSPSARQERLSDLLVEGALQMVGEAGAQLARLFVAGGAGWLQTAAKRAGFKRVRMIAHMQLPADAPTPDGQLPTELTLRSIRAGEDEEVLAALNRNWAGTWNFVEIPFEMLEHDLQGQRGGMLLAVDRADRIVSTCHAVYDEDEQNPDGNPRAWISNLTVDPTYRQKGVGRAMLGAGIAYLRNRGARSITLGVDASDPAPFGLYTSVGFQVASSIEAWDRSV